MKFDFNETPDLNITPLVDIMLVLLAILMVSMPTIVFDENIALPQGSKKEISYAKKQDLVVQINKNREIRIESNVMSIDNFPDNIALLSNKFDKNSSIYIRADKNLKYDDVILVLRSLKKVGFSKIALQTQG